MTIKNIKSGQTFQVTKLKWKDIQKSNIADRFVEVVDEDKTQKTETNILDTQSE